MQFTYYLFIYYYNNNLFFYRMDKKYGVPLMWNTKYNDYIYILYIMFFLILIFSVTYNYNYNCKNAWGYRKLRHTNSKKIK